MLVPRSAFAARKICDLQASRFALGGVLLERDADGRPFAVATDGRRLIALTWKEDDAANYPPVAGCDPSPVAGCSMLLPAAICDQAAKTKAGAKSPKPILRNIAIDEHDAESVAMMATDQNETARIDARQMEGRFPRWRDVVPQLRTDDIHVRLDARLLRGLLEVIESHNDTDVCSVVFSLNRENPAHRPVTLSVAGCNQSAVAVIMPCAAKDEVVLPPCNLHRLLDLNSYTDAEKAAALEATMTAAPAEPIEPAPEVIAVDLESETEEAAEVAATIEPAAELPPPPREITQPTKAPGKVKPRRVQDWRESARAVSLAAFV